MKTNRIFPRWIILAEGVQFFKFQKVFESIDVNGDGGISMMEWGYAMLDCFFNCGPDNMNSFFFGNIVDDDW